MYMRLTTHVRKLEKFSGNIREDKVTYVRIAQIAADSIKCTPTAIFSSPTVICRRNAINTQEKAKNVLDNIKNH